MSRVSVAWDDIGGLVDAHERFLAGARVERDVRSSVLASWKRCKFEGVEPHRVLLPYTSGLALDDRLMRAIDPVLKGLTASLANASMAVALCDPQARVVQRYGGGRRLLERLDDINFAPGFDVSERVAGTNGVGTALAGRGPIYLAGREHFSDCLQPFTCAGAPVRDPLSGRIEAVLDLTCLRGDGDPAMLRLVREAAHDIEARLLEEATERERALLAAYRRACRDPNGAGGGPQQAPQVLSGSGPEDGGLGRIDLAVLREKAEELLASPQRTLDEVPLSGGRVATLLRRAVTGAAGETGAVVEVRVLGGPSLRHVGLTLPTGSGRPTAVTATPLITPQTSLITPPVPPSPAPVRNAPAFPPALGPQSPRPTAVASPALPAAGPRSRIRAAAEGNGSGSGSADGWVLLVGEPGVGRLAVLARRRLELLHDASVCIGTTLQVSRTAEELAEVTVPRFADLTVVDLPDSVLLGEEPGPLGRETPLRRVALGTVREELPIYGIGEPVQYVPSTPQARCLETEQAVLQPVLADADGWVAQEPERFGQALAEGIHSLITVPLQARGTILGVASFYRSEKPAPFEDDDLSLAQELAGRAAICIDNARRYTREHNTALALQRSLLPRGRAEQNAVEAAYRYLPAQAGVGGDWFDVIPLSGARVALVVGDVVGHGLHAAATMGRLRTAVHNFSALDLQPEELLTQLDDLVGGLDPGEGWTAGSSHPDSGILGATCLYAVYDPVSRRCTLARAGHPQPAVVGPDGTVEFVDLPSGPPLGLGGVPFETVELELAEGSQLILYTDGLIEDRGRDIDAGLDKLSAVLACADRAPEDTCEAILDALLPARPADDVALLVARTRVMGPEQVAQWDLPSDPAVVSRSRAAVTAQLTAWGLDELAFSTELVASELVTNAIRYAAGPVRLRLLRDRALICEVSDGSSTLPRLRRARSEDEGGRGLFLVAQLTERWGTRYTTDGKIIWTEQPLP
ncbi:SpoIIE family protein phosphatase [Streptomyces sp. Li-HN-5-11]|uniref:SpoIIE family protein phosphatase n=1 Tax=Streptomyces sp. Li-HN-5-11 TaxID=3075432 RepID=UPI0028AE0D1F|nr:SpoIIE family protein phosphatase [Streptomyces sp. Li-HN-5-11]WNM29063.1 SpoIIE family protein phosphatase [Streptomyces sp. Li-HN-5-11]